MSAIRLARGFTGRKYIVKFDGCYHGHADSLLVSAGSGALTFGKPSSPGIPDELARLTIVLPYNNIEMLKETFSKRGKEIACAIVEPVAANMGIVLPDLEFLKELRNVTKRSGSILIFDEVITGFRVGLGGAQSYYNIEPDITCLGKIIGGGLPVGAYGGKKDIMKMLSPDGPIYQAGTLSGNPLAVSAGLTTIRILKRENPYKKLENLTGYLVEGLNDILRRKGIASRVLHHSSMLTLFFTDLPIKNLNDVRNSDTKRFKKFFSEMIKNGIYIPPSQFEAWFLSTSHTEEDIERTLKACKKAIDVM